jgi:[ribosomal protein S18]-alanine N-acetyltransferase
MPVTNEAAIQYAERAWRRSDLEILARIEGQAGSSSWSASVLRQHLEHPSSRTRVITAADAPDEPIAFYVLYSDVVSVYLANIAVDPAWRRRGVATFALQQIEAWSRRRQLPFIELHVREENLPAQLLYKKYGFVAVEIVRKHYRSEDGYAMRKNL